MDARNVQLENTMKFLEQIVHHYVNLAKQGHMAPHAPGVLLERIALGQEN